MYVCATDINVMQLFVCCCSKLSNYMLLFKTTSNPYAYCFNVCKNYFSLHTALAFKLYATVVNYILFQFTVCGKNFWCIVLFACLMYGFQCVPVRQTCSADKLNQDYNMTS